MSFRKNKTMDMLSVFHYGLAVLVILASLIPLLHLFIIKNLKTNYEPYENYAIGLTTQQLITLIILSLSIGVALAYSIFIQGNRLKAGQNYRYCFLVAILLCFFPLSLPLGFYTLLVLRKDESKEFFELTSYSKE